MKSELGIKVEFSGQSQMQWKPEFNVWHTEGMGWFKYFDKDEVESPHYRALGELLYNHINQKGSDNQFWSFEDTFEYFNDGQGFKVKVKVRNQPGNTEVKFKINNLENI